MTCSTIIRKLKTNFVLVFYVKTGLAGLEPVTSAVTGRCSNQLNYNPKSKKIHDAGGRGIRTLGIEELYNRLAIYRYRPLSHPSLAFLKIKFL